MGMAFLRLTDGEWYISSHVTPVKFWPYETSVTGRIMELPFHNGDSVDRMRMCLVKLFNEFGIKAGVDNKCVFEIDDDSGRRWCLGFYDLTLSLGTSCRRYF